MRIALAQINPTVGALADNAEQILAVITDCTAKVDLIVFPEMALTGYPPQDLLLESRFLEDTAAIFNKLVRKVTATPVILGTVHEVDDHLYNTAAILKDGQVVGWQDKSLLPTYDVFDELRYFTPAHSQIPISLTLNNGPVHLGVEICEDLWDDEYPLKVSQRLVEQGAEILINISASPFSVDKAGERLNLVSSRAKQLQRPFIYVNLVGAQDELVFDGSSLVVDEKGRLLAQLPAFQEAVEIVDLSTAKEDHWQTTTAEAQIFSALKLGVCDYFHKTGHMKAVVGLSGGIDSALVATIAAEALGAENVLGVTMPSQFSSVGSVDDSRVLARNLGTEFQEIPIKTLNEEMLKALDPVFSGTDPGIAEENIQARLRGNLLMAIANKRNALVLNTGNKTETALGYCTLYGDMCGALAVISDLNKLEVYAVSRWINKEKDREIIPESTLTKAPSAELRPDQVDPFDYVKVSPLIDAIVTENKGLNSLITAGYDRYSAREMLRLVRLTEHKRRQSAPGIRISPKAFGIGRRYPIVNGYHS